ncbi:MAG: hypothetical protein ABIP71_03930, partial [Verrucomicrobiota bacterium]
NLLRWFALKNFFIVARNEISLTLPHRIFVSAGNRAPWIGFAPASTPTSQVWGVRGGLLWAVSPGGFRPRGEPRGVIRLGYPILTNGA